MASGVLHRTTPRGRCKMFGSLRRSLFLLFGAGFPQRDAKGMLGTWVLTDNDNVPFNLILRADGSWSLRDNGSVMIKWTSGWRSLIKPPASGSPAPNQTFSVQHWRPGVPISEPASAIRSGRRL